MKSEHRRERSRDDALCESWRGPASTPRARLRSRPPVAGTQAGHWWDRQRTLARRSSMRRRAQLAPSRRAWRSAYSDDVRARSLPPLRTSDPDSTPWPALDLYVEVEVEPSTAWWCAVRARGGALDDAGHLPPGGDGRSATTAGHHRALADPDRPWPRLIGRAFGRRRRRGGLADPLAVAARMDGHAENAARASARLVAPPS